MRASTARLEGGDVSEPGVQIQHAGELPRALLAVTATLEALGIPAGQAVDHVPGGTFEGESSARAGDLAVFGHERRLLPSVAHDLRQHRQMRIRIRSIVRRLRCRLR